MTATHLSEGRTGLFIFILQRTLTSDSVETWSRDAFLWVSVSKVLGLARRSRRLPQVSLSRLWILQRNGMVKCL